MMASKRRRKRQDAETSTAAKLLAEQARTTERDRKTRRRQRRKAVRDLVTGVGGAVGFRYRAQLRPFYLLAGLWLAGLAAGTTHNPRGVLAAAILIGVPAVLFYLRRSLDRRAEQVYALCCCAAATAWLGLAAAGLTGNRAVDVAGVLTWAVAAGLWLREHRVRDVPAQPLTDTDLGAWWEQTGLFPGSRLEDVERIANGQTATLVLPPGRGNTTTAVIRVAEDIASAREKSLTTTLVEHTKDRAANRAQLTLLDASQVESVHPWPGPSLDPATGLAVVGPYADQGLARARFWRPGSGPKHWLVSGCSDAGKSRYLDWTLLEAAHCGLIASWVGDPQGGQSLPAWRDAAHRFADTPEGIVDMLRDLEREMDARSMYLARLEWTDEQGRTWVGKEDFDPTPEMPIIQVVIDEAQDILQQGSEAARIVIRLVRKGRKCGIRAVLVTHVPSIDEIGGSMTLRAQVVAGNVACLRTADNVTKNMVLPPSFPVNPYDIPAETTDGESTAGSLYLYGPGARPVLLRNYMIGKAKIHAAAADAPKIPLTLLSGESVRMPGRPWPSDEQPDDDSVPSNPAEAFVYLRDRGVIAEHGDGSWDFTDPEAVAEVLGHGQETTGPDSSSPDTSRPYPLDKPAPDTADGPPGDVTGAILALDWETHPERSRAQIIAALEEAGTPYRVNTIQKALSDRGMCRDGGEMVRVGHGLYRPAVGYERRGAA